MENESEAKAEHKENKKIAFTAGKRTEGVYFTTGHQRDTDDASRKKLEVQAVPKKS